MFKLKLGQTGVHGQGAPWLVEMAFVKEKGLVQAEEPVQVKIMRVNLAKIKNVVSNLQ